MLGTFARAILMLLVAAAPALADVMRIDVQSRGDLVGGQPFGAAGPYEKLSGKIFFAVDPSLPANRIVTDLDKAPRNAAGKVEFSADFYLIKPKTIARGNGAVLYEVSNRGGKGMLGFFNHASGSLDPANPNDVGDGFLMRQGFSPAGVSGAQSIPISYVPGSSVRFTTGRWSATTLVRKLASTAIVCVPVALPARPRNPHFDVPSSFFAVLTLGSAQSTSDCFSRGPSRRSARSITRM